jgi:hypothetical protein
MLRIVVLLAGTASVAAAAPCKDAPACVAACDGGDPAACAVATETTFRPLTGDKLTDADRKATACAYNISLRCSRFAAHLWAGVGVKVQREAAIAAWDRQCSKEGGGWDSCLAYAKAIQPTRQARAVEIYQDLCRSRDIELACRAAGRIWTRVKSSLRGKEFSVELPAAMRHIEPWNAGSWHVLWSVSTIPPDVEISVGDGGLGCTAGPHDVGDPKGEYAEIVARHAAKYRWLPNDWATRICASLRAE